MAATYTFDSKTIITTRYIPIHHGYSVTSVGIDSYPNGNIIIMRCQQIPSRAYRQYSAPRYTLLANWLPNNGCLLTFSQRTTGQYYSHSQTSLHTECPAIQRLCWPKTVGTRYGSSELSLELLAKESRRLVGHLHPLECESQRTTTKASESINKNLKRQAFGLLTCPFPWMPPVLCASMTKSDPVTTNHDAWLYIRGVISVGNRCHQHRNTWMKTTLKVFAGSNQNWISGLN